MTDTDQQGTGRCLCSAVGVLRAVSMMTHLLLST